MSCFLRKNLLLVLLAGSWASPVLAQLPAPAGPPTPAAQQPVYLLNSHLLVGDNWLRATNPQEIQSLEVYKDTNVPARWRSFVANGILNFTLKTPREPAAQKLTELSQARGLAEPVKFTLDGLPLEDPSLSIATDAIAALEIIHLAPGVTGTVVNIHLVRLPPTPSPPGVYLRGQGNK